MTDLAQISPGEGLWLWRHRQRYPMRGYSRLSTQHRHGSVKSIRDIAFELRIGHRRYIGMELDRVPLNGLTHLRIDNVTRGEYCALARRRSGLTLAEICNDLGMSRPRFHELEEQGDPVVVRYWQELGFKFPPAENIE